VVGKIVFDSLLDKDGEVEAKKEEGECFDDGDFYGQLLRDIVESRMLDLG
jgi:hypothetical protein